MIQRVDPEGKRLPVKLMNGLLLASVLSAVTLDSGAADFPAPREGSWPVRDFRFQSGETLPEMRLAYSTVGAPSGEPVIVLHGTTGSAANMLTPAFAGELFGAGQPLDAARYFIILPDALGHGKSSKPSDGLRMKFPRYNTEDMVVATHRLVSEHLGLKHARLVIGNSMGGMETWIFAVRYPAFMDIAVPMASLPTEMTGRNWLLRRMITESIRNDPEWKDGSYTSQPKSARLASMFFQFATNGGNEALAKALPTRAKTDALLEARLKAPFPGDANDILYQWESSGDYNPSAGLERIQAAVLAINSSDDERYPAELGILEREIRRVKAGRVLIILGNEDTAGHGTTGNAKWYKRELEEILKTAPRPH
jgi:homoserine O-acetyltransferase